MTGCQGYHCIQITENTMNRRILSWREENTSELKRQVEINILIGREFSGFIWPTQTHPYNSKGFLSFSFSDSGDIIGVHLGGGHLKADAS